MKILKLDARFHDARRIANCLIGNIACDLKDPYGFHGKFYGSNGFDAFYTEDGYGKTYTSFHTIYFLADEIRLCPFMAMREKVIVKSFYTSCVLNPIVSGLLKKMEFDGEKERFSIIEDGTIFDMCGFDEISIDLGPIERGELQGCEIVEVDE